MNSQTQTEMARQAIEAVTFIGKNIGKVAASIDRLAAAVENANEIAVKHNQWQRRETGGSNGTS